METFKTLNTLIIREWKRIFSIPNFYVVLLLIPLLVFPFYPLIYSKGPVHELPVAVWDEDMSPVSRTLTDMLDATAGLNIVGRATSAADVERQMQQGKIFGAVHFPKNLEADAKKGRPTSLTLYTNSSALVPSQLIYKDAAGVLIKGSLAVVLQKSHRSGLPENQAMALVQPVKLNMVTLYNPDFSYKHYLGPGLITVGLQMALIIASVLILNIEKARNTLPGLLKISTSSSQIIFTKTLAHLSVSWINFVLIFCLVLPLYGIEIQGSLQNIFLLYNLLALACIGLGMMVSALSDKLLFCVDLALFYTAPAFVFSGFTFPKTAMPWYDQLYAGAMPYTYFLEGFIRLFYMGLPLEYISSEICALLIFIGISFPVAIILYQFKLNKIRHEAGH